MKNQNFTFLKGLMLILILGAWQARDAQAQFGCDQGVVISDGYTAMGITTPGTGGVEDWNENPTDTEENGSYWDDDVYLFEYTAGPAQEQISMTIFTRNGWCGIGIFENCDGTIFSSPLSEDGQSGSDSERNVSAVIDANQTVYIAVGQWGTPNDLDFDVTDFSVSSCFDPADVVVTPSQTTAGISWTVGGSETSWNVQFGEPGFDAEAGEGTTEVADTNTDFEISGLSASTTYEVYVQADCGGETSAWVGPVEFTTLCAVAETPYLEQFTEFLPNCWQEASNGHLTEGPTDFGSGSWFSDEFLNEGDNNAAAINIYLDSKQDWLISPEINLEAAVDYQVEFDFAIVEYFSSTPEALGSDDSVSVVISVDGGGSWVELQTWDTNYTPVEGGEHIVIPLAGYEDNIVRIAFWGSEGTVNDEPDVDAMVDNFLVREVPTCPEPMALTTGTVEATSVLLSWEAGGSETMWNIQYGEPGFDPAAGEGTVVSADTNTDFELTGLDPETEYEVYVSAVCEAGVDESLYLSSTSFTTLPTCPDPSELTLDQELVNTATISWLIGNEETAWNVQYGADGFDPDANEGTILDATTNTEFEIPGLDAATEYDVYVQAECVEGTDLSNWVGPLSFTTLCAPYTPEYIQDFSDWLPICWQEGEGGALTEGPEELGGGGWTSDGFLNVGFSGAAKKNLYLSGDIDWLISPEIDLAAATEYQVEFDLSVVDFGSDDPINMGSDDSLSLVISGDGGATWEELQTWDTNYLMPEGGDYVVISLAGYEDDIVRLAFRASEGEVSDAADVDVHIDNFRVRETPNCPEPTTVTTEVVDFETALVSWTSNGEETAWNVQYGAPGFDPAAGEGTTVVADTNTDFEITGLDAETEYEVYVQAVCEEGVSESVLSTSASFTTLPTCPQPIDLVVNYYSNVEASLSWTSTGDETSWNVQFGEPGFDPVAGDGTTVVASSSDNFVIPGLDPNTEYDFYVQAECVEDTDLSDWTGALTITTDCDPFTPVYLEEFEGNFVPGCWADAGNGDPATGPSEYGDSDWNDDEFANLANGTLSANLNLYSNTDQEWMISPLIDLTTGGPYQVDMDFAITEWIAETPGVLGSDDEVQLLVSSDYGASWDTLAVFDSSYVSPQGGEMIVRDLTDYSGEIVKFAIWGSDGSVNDDNDNDIFFDNFRVREIPSCPEPLALTIDATTANSVEISWQAGSDETQWNVIYGAPGFDVEGGEGTVLSADNNEGFPIDGLDPATDYEIYVQAVCVVETDLSEFAGPVSVTTDCSFYTPTYEQDFTEYLPVCWQEADNGDASTGPEEFGESDWSDGDGAAVINLYFNDDKEWLISPELDLAGSANYQLEFDFAVYEWLSTTPSQLGSDDEVQVLISTGDDTSWDVLGTFDSTYVTPAGGETFVYSLADYEGDVVRIAFYATDGEVNDTEDNDVVVDNFRVRECLADASFSYSTDTICTYNSSIIPDITGLPGGTFSAGDGLDIDPETGEIDPATSDVGSYEVFYETMEDSLCTDMQMTTIVVDPCTGVDEFDNLTSVGVYPNPASSVLNLDFTGIDEKVNIEVMDMTGKVVMSETFANPSNEEINVSGFESGLYMIRLSTETSTVTKRVVVNK
ncbi:fibronectin type III domain-containing protein [Halocola ammonii]